VCTPCSEKDKKEDDNTSRNIFLQSGIRIPYNKLRNYKLDYIEQQEKIIQFIDSRLSEKTVVAPYIFGSPGTGKTASALLFCKKVIMEFKHNLVFYNVPSLIYEHRKNLRSVDIKLNASFMVLDDLGAHNISNWTLEILYNIIDSRLASSKPTLITSNIHPMNLAKHLISVSTGNVSIQLCEALMDRILELTYPIKVDGKSIRLDTAMSRTFDS
jgi:DNA replication protein DnaC